jgi:hypothetical protein
MQSYQRSPVRCESNLPAAYCVFRCGKLPQAEFFDPLGRKTQKTEPRAIELQGGIEIDARSHTYAAGYPPDEIIHKGKKMESSDQLLVDNTKRRVGEFLMSLKQVSQLSSFILHIGLDKFDFLIAPRKAIERRLTIGYTLQDNELSPTALVLPEADIALRGVLFSEHLLQECLPATEISEIDLLSLIQDGPRIAVSKATIQALLDNIGRAEAGGQLVNVATTQIKASQSVPLKAFHRKFIQQLTKKY